MRRLLVSLCCLTSLGCGAGGGAPSLPGPELERECSVTLPRARSAAGLVEVVRERSVEPSRVVVELEEPLASVLSELEPRVQRKLAAGRAGLGPAGSVSYEVERGPLSASVKASSLVIEAAVAARAEACRGANCYASCQPEAVVSAEVPLLLRADYGFEPARVSLRFTRGCKVRALGGLLTLDVTPTLRQQLEPELVRIGHEIDRHVPKLRPELERGYRLAAEPRPLPLLGCFVLAPEGVVQGPVESSSTHLRARFALLARPELRPSCGAPTSTPTLPPLQRDPALPRTGDVRLGLVSELAQVERALSSAGQLLVAGKRARVARAEVRPRGSDVSIKLTLAGQICGDVTFAATPSFAREEAHIALASPRASAAERARIESAGLDADELLSALAASARLPPALSPTGFKEAVPALISALSTGPFKLTVSVDSAYGGGAAARGAELVAWLKARGTANLTR